MIHKLVTKQLGRPFYNQRFADFINNTEMNLPGYYFKAVGMLPESLQKQYSKQLNTGMYGLLKLPRSREIYQKLFKPYASYPDGTPFAYRSEPEYLTDTGKAVTRTISQPLTNIYSGLYDYSVGNEQEPEIKAQ